MSTRTTNAAPAPAAPAAARGRSNYHRTTKLVTVPQFEQMHPALAGRLRQWMHRADAGDAEFAGLRRAIVRVGRSVFIDAIAADEFFVMRSAVAPSPSRRNAA